MLEATGNEMVRLGLFCLLFLALCACEDRAQEWLSRGNALAAKGKLDEASRAYQEARALLPTDSRPLELYGNIKLEQRDPAAARGAFEEALKLNPAAIDALVGLGRIEGRAGKLDAALNHLAQAVDKAPDRSDARAWRATFLVARGTPVDLELALQDADHVLTSEPSDEGALYVRGNVLLAQKKFDAAKKAFEELGRAAPASPLGDYGLARLAAAQGDRLGALAQLRQAREKSRQDPTALPPEQVRADPAFRFLENDPDFTQLIPR